jgi:hypothetical protein
MPCAMVVQVPPPDLSSDLISRMVALQQTPAMSMPLSPFAPMIPETCVPWP